MVHFVDDLHNTFKDSIAVWGKKKPKKVVPVILISEKDAFLLKDIILDAKKVVLSIDIDSTTKKSNHVTLEYYIMINDHLSYELLNKLYEFKFSLPASFVFKPIYAFKDMRKDVNHLSVNCFNGNRYCVHANRHQPYETSEYRDETIRQLCLLEQTSQNRKLEKMWWKYVIAYAKACFNKSASETLKDCSDTVFDLADIDPDIVKETKRCFNKFVNQYDSISIIDSQMKKQYDFEQYPGVIVNDNLVRGYRSSKSIVTSVCDAFDSKPYTCTNYEPKFKTTSYVQKFSFLHLYGIIVFCALVISTLVIVVRKYMHYVVHEAIKEDVKEHVHTYYKINETDSRFKDTELTPAETTG